MTATELSHCANVSPQTASSHLAQLTEAGLLALEKQGRHHYYRLANSDVAHALEALMLLVPKQKSSHPTAPKPIHLARRCYDHIAGRLGVQLTASMLEKGWLSTKGKDYIITTKGEKGLASFGLDLVSIRQQRRYFARQCLDWSERQHHVAGALGAALLDNMLELKWLRKDKTERVLHITQDGYEGLENVFNLRLQIGK